MAAEEKLQSEIVNRAKWGALRPRLNYRTGPLCSMPPTIDPRNWTEVTPEDLRAHQERLTIRGRLRREFWMKAYHPTNWKHFNQINSDKQFIRLGRLKTVWHMKDTIKPTGKTPLLALLCVVTPIAMAVVMYKNTDPKWKSIFDM